MEQPTSFFSFLLVLVAIGLAWLAGYRTRFHQFPGLKRSSQQDYFVGLNYLLNDEPDDAIDIFIEALEINSDTLATHLALGTLLRRRGKVDRSISHYQQLLEIGNFSGREQCEIKIQLARSFISAGLLDRAERLLEELAKHRDEIVNKASDIRRAYESIKSKQEILSKESANNPEDFENMTSKLLQLKSEFDALKSQRQEVAEKIAAEDIKIDKIDAEITLRKKKRRESGSDDYQQVGNINRKISTLRAELVLIDTQMRQIYTEVGKYISRNSSDPKCVKLSKKKQSIIHVMLILRKSINLNRKLADVK